MSECTVDMKQVAQDATALYVLYDVYGRGKVSEWDWCFMYIKGDLADWLSYHYGKDKGNEQK